jgi:hypothetical protein
VEASRAHCGDARNLKNRGRWRSLKSELGGNLLRTPNPVHRSGGGVRAFWCGHGSRDRLFGACGGLLLHSQPSAHIPYVVGDFATSNSRECRPYARAPPIDQTVDSYAEQSGDLLRGTKIDFTFIVLHVSIPKGRTATLPAACRWSAHPAPIPISVSAPFDRWTSRAPWQPIIDGRFLRGTYGPRSRRGSTVVQSPIRPGLRPFATMSLWLPCTAERSRTHRGSVAVKRAATRSTQIAHGKYKTTSQFVKDQFGEM